jgi:DNA-binding PadR family transcriptional regulator
MNVKKQFRTDPSIGTGNNNGKELLREATPREKLVLFAIGYHERYGLEIQRAITECSGGTESISIGTLYPTLHSLERKHLITSRYSDETYDDRGGARRRYYKLTDNGLSCIKAIQQYQSDLLTWQST